MQRVSPPQNYWGEGGKRYVAPPPFKIIGGLPPGPLFLRLCVFRERLSVCVFASFPYGFEGGVWDLIIFISLPFYLLSPRTTKLWRGYRVCPVRMYVSTYVRTYVRTFVRMFTRSSDLIYYPISI